MINKNKSVKKVVLSAIFFLCVLAMLLCGTFGNSCFVLASAHGANAETAAEGAALDTDVIMGISWTIRDYPEQLQ